MNITLEADYALRIVYLFATDNVKTDAGTLAEKVGVSPRFALKILRKLLLAGIVKSFKGTHGGYMLAKDASQVSMYDVICAIDGCMPINRCTDESFQCQNPNVKLGLPCSMHCVFMEVCAEVKKKLSSETFDKLVK